jgi:small-conductance mechanosensitive channel
MTVAPMGSLAVAFYQSPWFRALAIMGVAFVAGRVVNALLARRERSVTKLLAREAGSAGHTRFVMVRRLTQATIFFVGIAFALGQFPQVGAVARAMLASVAIVAAIVGIAARAPIANFVSGIMIAFSQPVRLGDYISINDVYGTVEEIRLTYTYIRTLDNRRVVIPNEAFASTAVNNYSMGKPGSMVEVTFAVPVSADLERVRSAALSIADELAPPPDGCTNDVDVRDLSPEAVTLRVSAWSTEPIDRRRLASDLRTALHRKLRSDGLLGPIAPADGPAEEDDSG